MAAHLVPMLEGQCAVRRGTLLEGAASAAPESADPEQAATNAAIKDIHRGCGYRLEILWRIFQTHANFPLDGITQMSGGRGSVTSRSRLRNVTVAAQKRCGRGAETGLRIRNGVADQIRNGT